MEFGRQDGCGDGYFYRVEVISRHKGLLGQSKMLLKTENSVVTKESVQLRFTN